MSRTIWKMRRPAKQMSSEYMQHIELYARLWWHLKRARKKREMVRNTFASNPFDAIASFDGRNPNPLLRCPPPPVAVFPWFSEWPAPEPQPSWRLWKSSGGERRFF